MLDRIDICYRPSLLRPLLPSSKLPDCYHLLLPSPALAVDTVILIENFRKPQDLDWCRLEWVVCRRAHPL